MRKRVGGDGKKGANLLIIGESPGENEEEQGKPFVGYAGQKLFECLNRYGVYRQDVYLMNLSEYRPAGNKFENCSEEDIRDGLSKIHEYIHNYRPNCILSLGEYPLRYLTGRYSISAHRGSILRCNIDNELKVCASYHPSFILRSPANLFLFDFDVKRAIEQAKSPLFPYRDRNYVVVDSSSIELASQEILKQEIISVDIETTKKDKSIICVGFGVSPDKAYSFPWDQLSYVYIKEILESNNTKIFHYGYGFDIEILHLHGIEVSGRIEDTYFMTHSLDPLLPKGLDFLTSVHTLEPYYKSQGRSTLPGDTKDWSDKVNRLDVYQYNGKDCCVTYEIFLVMKEFLCENDIDTYEFEIEDARLAQKISRTGLPFDEEAREKLKDAIILKWKKAQLLLNSVVGFDLNVGSYTQVPKLLYDIYKLPEKTNKDGKRTADDDAIVELIGFIEGRIESIRKEETKNEWRLKQMVLIFIRNIRSWRKLLSSYMNVELVNGRVLSMYNAAGTGFGRWSCAMYVDGTGINSQTWPRGSFEIPESTENLDEFKSKIAKEFTDDTEI